MVRELEIIRSRGVICFDSPKSQGNIQGPGNNRGNTAYKMLAFLGIARLVMSHNDELHSYWDVLTEYV